MKTEEEKEYNRLWMKAYRRKKWETTRGLVNRAAELLLEDRCPWCEMFLKDLYHLQNPCFHYELYLFHARIEEMKDLGDTTENG